MTTQYFQNGTIRLIKENLRYNKIPVFRVWVFVSNTWIFDKRISAQDINQAYENYVNQEGV